MFYACQYAALVPVPLPAAIHLGGHEAYVRHLRQMVLDCRPRRHSRPTISSTLLREAVSGPAGGSHRHARRISTPLPDLGELPEPPRVDELAYLQYTSGSTRFPRGTMITQASVMHNLEAIFNHGFRLTQDDRFFSWLPYYHDMGLVGIVLGCMATQRSVRFPGLARIRDAAAPVAEADVAEPRDDLVQSAVRLCAGRAPHHARRTPNRSTFPPGAWPALAPR